MDATLHGIIIRKYPLTESSLILHWMTRECGRIKTAAKGARKLKSGFKGKPDLLDSGTLSIRRSRQSDLHTLVTFDLESRPTQIAGEISRLQVLSYGIELLETVSEIEIPHPGLFDWFQNLLGHLDGKSPDAAMLSQLELSFLKTLGLQPAPDVKALGAPLSKLLGDWMRGSKLRREEISEEEMILLNRWTASLLRQELHKIPRSRPEL